MTVDARARARELLRVEAADAIFDVFAERGFEAVTVEEAARAVGLSRATFFRHFGSKEEVVLTALQQPAAALPVLVRDLPAPPGMTAWELLRRAHDPLAAHADAQRDRLVTRVRMIMQTPSLRSHMGAPRLARELAITEALAGRLLRPAEAAPVTAGMLALVDLAWRTWAEGEGGSFGTILDQSMGVVAGGGALAR